MSSGLATGNTENESLECTYVSMLFSLRCAAGLPSHEILRWYDRYNHPVCTDKMRWMLSYSIRIPFSQQGQRIFSKDRQACWIYVDALVELNRVLCCTTPKHTGIHAGEGNLASSRPHACPLEALAASAERPHPSHLDSPPLENQLCTGVSQCGGQSFGLLPLPPLACHPHRLAPISRQLHRHTHLCGQARERVSMLLLPHEMSTTVLLSPCFHDNHMHVYRKF